MWTDTLRWIVLNTLLAVVPVGAAYTMRSIIRQAERHILAKISVAAIGFIWLIFLPNTCYLLTEWRHFLDMVGYTNLYAQWQVSSLMAMKLMAYTLFYICFSGVGLLTFALAIRPIARTAKEKGFTLWIWGIPLFLINSVGVYLGLIKRFNSWDIFRRPNEILKAVADIPGNQDLATLVLLFSIFLWLVYLAVDIWIDGLICRYKGHQNICK